MPDILALGNWNMSQIKIDLNAGNEISKSFKKYTNNIWTRYKKKFPQAFDGKLGKLKLWKADSMYLKLDIESVNFSSYIATRAPNFVNKFPKTIRANPLGLTIIVETADNKIIVGQRSLNADQNAGKLYFIGGYLNPSCSKNPKNILKVSIQNEIYEEINISKKYIRKLTAMCLIYNKIHCHPELFVVANLDVTEKFIRKKWHLGVDSKEIEEIFFYKKADLIDLHNKKQLPFRTTTGLQIGIKYLIPKI